MGKKSSRAAMQDEARSFAEDLRDRIEHSYGVLGFAPGSPLRSRIGTRVSNLAGGGLCVRIDSRGEVYILVRIVLGYRVRAVSVALSISEAARFLLRGKPAHLKAIEVSIEGVKLAS